MTHLPQAPTRRTVLRAAAWTAPAVSIAVAAPAFATASNSIECKPTGCKAPGEGTVTKDYYLSPGCGPLAEILAVTIGGSTATLVGDQWVVYGQPDSEAFLPVTITFSGGQTWTGSVKFPPCK